MLRRTHVRERGEPIAARVDVVGGRRGVPAEGRDAVGSALDRVDTGMVPSRAVPRGSFGSWPLRVGLAIPGVMAMSKPAWAAGTSVLAANASAWPVAGAAAAAGLLALWALRRSFRSPQTFVPLGLAQLSTRVEQLGLSDQSAAHFLRLGKIEAALTTHDTEWRRLADNSTDDGWSDGQRVDLQAALATQVEGLVDVTEALADISSAPETLELSTTVAGLGQRALRAHFPLARESREHLEAVVAKTSKIQRELVRGLPRDGDAFAGWPSNADIVTLGQRLNKATGFPASHLLTGISGGHAALWALDRAVRYQTLGVAELPRQFLRFANHFARRMPTPPRDTEAVRMRALFNVVEVGLRRQSQT